jgi:hypothetical protein
VKVNAPRQTYRGASFLERIMQSEKIVGSEVIVLPIEGKVCECPDIRESLEKLEPDIREAFEGCFCGGCGGIIL